MNCVICGDEAKNRRSVNNVGILYCPRCGHFFCDAAEIGRGYSVYAEYEYLLKPLRDKNYGKTLKLLSGILPPNAIGLEVGSALEWFLQKCVGMGYTMTGVEPMTHNFEKSHGQGYNVINGYFPECLPEERYKRSFDFIIFNDVIEHIGDTKKTLAACAELLKTDGYLVVNLPLNTGVFFKAASFLSIFGKDKPLTRLWQFETESPHLHYFSSRSLKKIANETGYRFRSAFGLQAVDLNPQSTYRRIVGFGRIKRVHALIIAAMTLVAAPLLKILPKDTKCLIFERSDRR